MKDAELLEVTFFWMSEYIWVKMLIARTNLFSEIVLSQHGS